MKPFSYTRAVAAEAGIRQVTSDRIAKFIGGGTNLVDLMDEGVEQPARLVDINRCTSYAFALVSVAAALEIKQGKILQARLAMGGVAHKPWRALEAEQILVGAPPDQTKFRQAAEATLRQAKGYEHNRFKIEMGKRALVRTLQIVTEMGERT